MLRARGLMLVMWLPACGAVAPPARPCTARSVDDCPAAAQCEVLFRTACAGDGTACNQSLTCGDRVADLCGPAAPSSCKPEQLSQVDRDVVNLVGGASAVPYGPTPSFMDGLNPPRVIVAGGPEAGALLYVGPFGASGRVEVWEGKYDSAAQHDVARMLGQGTRVGEAGPLSDYPAYVLLDPIAIGELDPSLHEKIPALVKSAGRPGLFLREPADDTQPAQLYALQR